MPHEPGATFCDVVLDGEKMGEAAIRPTQAVGDVVAVAGPAGFPDGDMFTVTEIHPDTHRLAVAVPSKDDDLTRTT